MRTDKTTILRRLEPTIRTFVVGFVCVLVLPLAQSFLDNHTEAKEKCSRVAAPSELTHYGFTDQETGDDYDVTLRFDTPPYPLRKVMMACPDTCVAPRDGEDVLVLATIDTCGTVVQAEVVRRSSLLERLAVEAALQWRFTPAKFRDKPVTVNYIIPMWFDAKER